MNLNNVERFNVRPGEAVAFVVPENTPKHTLRQLDAVIKMSWPNVPTLIVPDTVELKVVEVVDAEVDEGGESWPG